MKPKPKIQAIQYIDDLLGQGRYTFAKQEAIRYLGSSSNAVYMALYRLVKAGRLCAPKSGFYVIVDAQHRSVKTLPPEWFIHELMGYLKIPYYVGLLSAAQLHGAAHQQPQEFQVVIPERTLRPVRCGNVTIQFAGKGPFKKGILADIKVPTGFIKVSSPETTAWDLVRYSGTAGGMDNVVTVLNEMAERLTPEKLLDTAKRHGDFLVTRRLGFILESLGHKALVEPLIPLVGKEPIRKLDPASPAARAKTDLKWRLAVNLKVEPEA